MDETARELFFLADLSEFKSAFGNVSISASKTTNMLKKLTIDESRPSEHHYKQSKLTGQRV